MPLIPPLAGLNFESGDTKSQCQLLQSSGCSAQRRMPKIIARRDTADDRSGSSVRKSSDNPGHRMGTFLRAFRSDP